MKKNDVVDQVVERPVRPFAMRFFKASRTDQSAARDADIAVVMARYTASGDPRVLSAREGFGVDCTAIPDFRDIQERLIEARQSFDALPSKIRDRFADSPIKFFEFCQDPSNLAEAVALGLAVEKAPPKVSKKPEEKPSTEGPGKP